MSRVLRIDVCDYQKKIICNLYDSASQVSGNAVNVFCNDERNGWKELNFTIPSRMNGENEPEDNYRINYLMADYKLRAETEEEVDWYLISEPKISHRAFSKDVTVVAGHISQLLKNKNLGLEFSDEEGNNTGTCLELLTTILEGTGWSPGMVTQFMEDDDFTKEKKRSMTAEARSGALKLISDLCEVFAAKPVYHGDSYTVDILPMNPFSCLIDNTGDRLKAGKIIELAEGEIPAIVTNDQVLEIAYQKNMSGISRTLNTENIATCLTALGSPDDTTLGACSLMNAEHNEYTFAAPFDIPEGEEIEFSVEGENWYFIAKTDISEGTTLFWSALDAASQSYLWDGDYAHPVSSKISIYGEHRALSNPAVQTVQNWFSYLMNFSYYEKIGLFTEEMRQEVARFQLSNPALIETSYHKNIELSDALSRLSEIGESNDGFLKLAVKNWSATSNNAVLLNIDTEQGDDGVLYRSDYQENRRYYFTWHVAEKIKSDGTALNNLGSVIYAIKKRDGKPPLWRMNYLKMIDNRKTTRKDIDGNIVSICSNYVYATSDGRPETLTLFADYTDWINAFGSLDGVEFFLFCGNSMTGLLGQKQSADEAAVNTLANSTKVVTDLHPTVFAEKGKSLPSPADTTATYAWGYIYDPDTENSTGELYFCCNGIYSGELAWARVFCSETEVNAPAGQAYYFNTKYKTLYHSDNSKWVLMDSVEEKRIAQGFTKVLYYCLRRDMIYKGLYEEYVHEIAAETSFPVGNYAIASPFGFYWLFTTDKSIDAGITGAENYTFTADDFTMKNYVYESGKISVTAGAWYACSFTSEVRIDTYNASNILIGSTYYTGKISIQMLMEASYLILVREELPTNTETIQAKTGCEIWVDTQNNVVYQERNVASIVEAQCKAYDTLTFPPANILTGVNFVKGSVDNKGIEIESGYYQRSYNLDVYGSTEYEYNLPSGSKIAIYDSNKYYTRTISGGTGMFTTLINEGYIKVVSPSTPDSRYYVRVKNYADSLFVDDKQYRIIDAAGRGTLKGINNLMGLLADTANEAYLEYLPALLEAQENVRQNERNLQNALGDIYREGRWETDDYVKGDEAKLYGDATRNLNVVCRPEARYDIEFKDLYGTEKAMGDESFPWPDINIQYAVHLIDPEIDVNLWAYIDELKKCYDQPWETSLTVNTDLSDIGQHDFTDVMTYIADVAQTTKANQSVYARAESFESNGTLDAEKLTGDISALNNRLFGGRANWYTDANGNLVIESATGNGAMMLTGEGFMIANSKNADGDWNWKTYGTGEGFNADLINAGTFNGALIKAKSIQTNQVSSDFGQQLDIISNMAIMLCATVDGTRPAGGLETGHPDEGDSYILIKAKDENGDAEIDIASGGKLKIDGGSGIEIGTEGNINMEAGASFTVASDKFAIDEEGNVKIEGSVVANEGEIAGFKIANKKDKDGNVVGTALYTDEKSAIDKEGKGVYLGTDGINIGGKLIASYDGSIFRFLLAADQVVLSDGTTSLEEKLQESDVDLSGKADKEYVDQIYTMINNMGLVLQDGQLYIPD